jgi:hypothetical protein
MVAKLWERLSVNKEVTQRFALQRFDLKMLNYAEFKA